MRLAIAVKNNEIAEHFGHCDYFQVYNISNNIVESEEKIINPPHQKGLLPKFLKDNGIDSLITGNIGSLAVDKLEELGIEAVRGVKGSLQQILKEYLKNTLVSTDDTCEGH
ncbi:MAG: NifB/NifX family molybdenum-iron cluster-binding protein [Candidatus Izemoplasmatales bacterium]